MQRKVLLLVYASKIGRRIRIRWLAKFCGYERRGETRVEGVLALTILTDNQLLAPALLCSAAWYATNHLLSI